MSIFHSHQWRIPASDPTIHAARYPQIIELTRLLASPFWRTKAQLDWPEPTEFINEHGAPWHPASDGASTTPTASTTHSSS